MEEIDFSRKILISIAGKDNIDWQSKLEEIKNFNIDEVAVFLTRFDRKERDHFYKFLLKSSIKKIPFVHLRDDTGKEDIEFFIKNFQTEYFNIHEHNFKILDIWKGYWDKLYLEMNYDDIVIKEVDVESIAGFCIDLSHFKSAIARGTEDAAYIFAKKNEGKFICNHLNGYDEEKKCDAHFVSDLSQFDYLKTLPKFVFGKIIALEVDNSIKEQIIFKKYLEKFLADYLN